MYKFKIYMVFVFCIARYLFKCFLFLAISWVFFIWNTSFYTVYAAKLSSMERQDSYNFFIHSLHYRVFFVIKVYYENICFIWKQWFHSNSLMTSSKNGICILTRFLVMMYKFNEEKYWNTFIFKLSDIWCVLLWTISFIAWPTLLPEDITSNTCGCKRTNVALKTSHKFPAYFRR